VEWESESGGSAFVKNGDICNIWISDIVKKQMDATSYVSPLRSSQNIRVSGCEGEEVRRFPFNKEAGTAWRGDSINKLFVLRHYFVRLFLNTY
jgi:hypothetical protein